MTASTTSASMVICNVAVAAGPGQRGVNARWSLRVARQFVDAENSPSAALPLQRVEAPIILWNLVRVAERSVEGHRDLAVHRVMADHDHGAAKAAPGNVSQPLDRPAGHRGRGGAPSPGCAPPEAG